MKNGSSVGKGALVDLKVDEEILFTLDSAVRIRVILEHKRGQSARLRLIADPEVKFDLPAKVLAAV